MCNLIGGSMNIKNPFIIKCNNCGKTTNLKLVIECVSSYSRKLGDELEYSGTYDGYCPHCNSEITITIDAWEYPYGHINQFLISVKGASCLDNLKFSFE